MSRVIPSVARHVAVLSGAAGVVVLGGLAALVAVFGLVVSNVSGSNPGQGWMVLYWGVGLGLCGVGLVSAGLRIRASAPRKAACAAVFVLSLGVTTLGDLAAMAPAGPAVGTPIAAVGAINAILSAWSFFAREGGMADTVDETHR